MLIILKYFFFYGLDEYKPYGKAIHSKHNDAYKKSILLYKSFYFYLLYFFLFHSCLFEILQEHNLDCKSLSFRLRDAFENAISTIFLKSLHKEN